MSKFHLYHGRAGLSVEPRTVCGLNVKDVRPHCANLDHRHDDGHALELPAGADRCTKCFQGVAPELVKTV